MQQLLDSCGAAWCVAPREAESLLATLQVCGHIDEIVTEDSDAIVCGAASILRNFWTLRGTGAVESAALRPQRVRTSVLLAALGIDAPCLRAAAVLAGCDFAPKLRNVGLVGALRAVAVHRTDVAGCLRALKHYEVANAPEQLNAYLCAAALLEAPPAEGLPETPPASFIRICPTLAMRAVVAAEKEGEPWRLRTAFGVGLLEGPRPRAYSLVPGAWLQPRQNAP